MNKKYTFNNINYTLLEDYKNAFDEKIVGDLITDYFNDFDYIVGDSSYGKLRLKGFCMEDNKLFKSYNDFNKYKEYIKNDCTYDCKYFVLKKD